MEKEFTGKLSCYMAIFGGALKFVLIDSESDKDPAAHEDCIFITDYLPV